MAKPIIPVPTLILASRSVRRAQLLRDRGYVFEQLDPPFADPPQPSEALPADAVAVAVDLATKKALSSLKLKDLQTRDGIVVVGADTICVGQDGRLLGQPADREQARQMILGFVNRSHQVISAAAVAGTERPEPQTLADTATVHIGPLDEGQLETYLDGGQWRGKAGGYNLFDRLAEGWPITVSGDPATVVGLPMQLLEPVLALWSVRPEAAQEPDGL